MAHLLTGGPYPGDYFFLAGAASLGGRPERCPSASAATPPLFEAGEPAPHRIAAHRVGRRQLLQSQSTAMTEDSLRPVPLPEMGPGGRRLFQVADLWVGQRYRR